MSQQQQQQQGKTSPVPASRQQPSPTREEQLLAIIATLQQQVNTMLLHQQGSRVEVVKPQVFGGKMEEVSAFINAACLYLRMKMTDETATTQVAWVLSYVVTPQMNFPWKITFDMLYTNEFLIRVRSRVLFIPSERTTI